MAEDAHLERRLQLLEDRQKGMEERQGRFDAALATLRTDLVDTERRLTENINIGIQGVRTVIENEVGKVEQHLTVQDGHLLNLSGQIGVARSSWPVSAKVLATTLAVLLAGMLPILYFILPGK